MIVVRLFVMNFDSLSTTHALLTLENLNHGDIIDAHIQRTQNVYLMLLSLDHKEIHISPPKSIDVLRLVPKVRQHLLLIKMRLRILLVHYPLSFAVNLVPGKVLADKTISINDDGVS